MFYIQSYKDTYIHFLLKINFIYLLYFLLFFTYKILIILFHTTYICIYIYFLRFKKFVNKMSEIIKIILNTKLSASKYKIMRTFQELAVNLYYNICNPGEVFSYWRSFHHLHILFIYDAFTTSFQYVSHDNFNKVPNKYRKCLIIKSQL